MADSNRQAVGLVGLQFLLNSEQAFDHVLYLILVGGAAADDEGRVERSVVDVDRCGEGELCDVEGDVDTARAAGGPPDARG